MKLIYGTGFDFSTSPWADEGAAQLGRRWLGPAGLLEELELRAGCGMAPPDESFRLIDYYRALAGEADGSFYEQALRDSPLAVASHLLEKRDELAAGGFRFRYSEGMPQRIEDLCRVEESLPEDSSVRFGYGDRANRLIEAIEREGAAPVTLDEVELRGRREFLPPAVARILQTLEAHGITVRSVPADSLAPQQSDLGKVQRALSAGAGIESGAAGDGSVRIESASTVDEALQQVSRYLRDAGFRNSTAVLVPEGRRQLDEFLAADGSPAGGSRDDYPASLYSCLHLIPLFLWEPIDVRALAALLASPASPFPARMSRRLRDALLDVPGIGNPQWEEALRSSLDEIEENERREKIAGRYERLVHGTRYSRREGAPIEELERLCREFDELLRARAAAGGDGQSGQLAAGCRWIAQAGRAFFDGRRVTAERLSQLIARYVDMQPRSAREEEAGKPRLASSPAEMDVPAERILWVPALEQNGQAAGFFTARELRWLGEAGVLIEAPRTAARRRFASAVDALCMARREVIFVLPAGSEHAERTADPIVPVTEALLGRGAGEREDFGKIELDTESRPGEEVTVRELPRRRPYWQCTAGTVKCGRVESFSSLRDLIYYPYRYVLSHHARLRRASLALPEGVLLYGNLLHAAAQRLLSAGTIPAKEQVRFELDGFFDHLLETHGLPLLQPGKERTREYLRGIAGRTLEHLVTLLGEAGAEKADCEAYRNARYGSLELKGQIDVLGEGGEQPAVIDLKWGGYTVRRDEIEAGTDLQLAVYAALLGASDGQVASAFLIAGRNAALAHPGSPYASAESPSGASPEEESVPRLLDAVEQAAEYRYRQIEAGTIALSPEDSDDSLPDGPLKLPEKGYRYDEYVHLLGWSEQ